MVITNDEKNKMRVQGGFIPRMLCILKGHKYWLRDFHANGSSTDVVYHCTRCGKRNPTSNAGEQDKP